MPKHHAKFHQNWWCSFRDVTGQDTEGHSFIIIRMYKNTTPFYSFSAFVTLHKL